MTVYAPTDTRAINIPTDRGGCDQPHEAGDLGPGERFVVNCPLCEPYIIAMRTGWAHTVDGVHMTPDEIGMVEVEEARAARERNRTLGSPTAIGKAFAEAMASVAAPSAPSLMAQIAALSGEERAALASMLTAAAGDEDDEDETAEDGNGNGEAVKRRPGRPRKNPEA